MNEIVSKPTISKTVSQLREKGGVVWYRLCGGVGWRWGNGGNSLVIGIIHAPWARDGGTRLQPDLHTFKIHYTHYIQNTLHILHLKYLTHVTVKIHYICTLVTLVAFSIYINADGAIYPLGNPLSNPATMFLATRSPGSRPEKNSTASEKPKNMCGAPLIVSYHGWPCLPVRSHKKEFQFTPGQC